MPAKKKSSKRAGSKKGVSAYRVPSIDIFKETARRERMKAANKAATKARKERLKNKGGVMGKLGRIAASLDSLFIGEASGRPRRQFKKWEDDRAASRLKAKRERRAARAKKKVAAKRKKSSEASTKTKPSWRKKPMVRKKK